MMVMKLLHVMVLGCLLTCLSVAAAMSADDQDIRCLALNLYFEARSEGDAGMVAVGWVVLNRVADATYPNTVCEVIHQGGEQPPCQWNWWCDGRSDRPTEPQAWAQAQQIAQRLLSEPPPDPTHGALWFHNASVARPDWLKVKQQSAHIGDHLFYK
jgi:spore germination cell wall hydrolase CwlJ-like protein